MQRSGHDKVHAPNRHRKRKAWGYALRAQRAVADAGRWATIYRRAAITLLAVLARASHAQVDEQPYNFFQSGLQLIYFGPEPYDLFGSNKKKLLVAAQRMVSPGAQLYNVRAYYDCVEVPADVGKPPKCIEAPRAKLLYGSFDLASTPFSLDSITCTRSKSRQWNCEPKETWTYFRTERLEVLVYSSGGVGLETAKLIAAYDGKECRLPMFEKKKRNRHTDLEEILSAPHIYLEKETGSYVRRTESCLLKLEVKDGKIESPRVHSISR